MELTEDLRKRVEQLTHYLITEGDSPLWRAIAGAFPEAETGDFVGHTRGLADELSATIGRWVELNHPDPDGSFDAAAAVHRAKQRLETAYDATVEHTGGGVFACRVPLYGGAPGAHVLVTDPSPVGRDDGYAIGVYAFDGDEGVIEWAADLDALWIRVGEIADDWTSGRGLSGVDPTLTDDQIHSLSLLATRHGDARTVSARPATADEAELYGIAPNDPRSPVAFVDVAWRHGDDGAVGVEHYVVDCAGNLIEGIRRRP